MTGSPATMTALQTALEAEQAASYGYGIAGAHLGQGSARQAAATADWTAHLTAAGELSSMISARGGTPAPAAVAYQLPSPVRTTAEAITLAWTLEDAVARAYLGLVALPELVLRRFGADQVRAAALRAEAWRGTTRAFPGLPATSLRA